MKTKAEGRLLATPTVFIPQSRGILRSLNVLIGQADPSMWEGPQDTRMFRANAQQDFRRASAIVQMQGLPSDLKQKARMLHAATARLNDVWQKVGMAGAAARERGLINQAQAHTEDVRRWAREIKDDLNLGFKATGFVGSPAQQQATAIANKVFDDAMTGARRLKAGDDAGYDHLYRVQSGLKKLAALLRATSGAPAFERGQIVKALDVITETFSEVHKADMLGRYGQDVHNYTARQLEQVMSLIRSAVY